jgi:phospholipase C
LTLTLTNTGAEGVHFALYPYLGELAEPEHFDVDRRHREEITLTGDAYALVLTGPNDFRREFKGAVSGVAAEVEVTAAAHSSGKVLEITVDNHGRTPLTVILAAQAYGSQTRRITIPERGRQSVPFTTQHGWYDVAVTVAQDGSFKRRLAGRLENGEPSISG